LISYEPLFFLLSIKFVIFRLDIVHAQAGLFTRDLT
jgi:hypothetical protein